MPIGAVRNDQGACIAERQASGHNADTNESPGHDDVEYVDSKTRSKVFLSR